MRGYLDPREFIIVLVAAVFASVAILPLVPHGGVLLGGVVLGLAVLVVRQAIVYGLGGSFHLDVRSAALYVFSGIIASAFLLGVIEGILPDNVAVFASGIAFYIAYVAMRWAAHATGVA